MCSSKSLKTVSRKAAASIRRGFFSIDAVTTENSLSDTFFATSCGTSDQASAVSQSSLFTPSFRAWSRRSDNSGCELHTSIALIRDFASPESYGADIASPGLSAGRPRLAFASATASCDLK